VLRRIRSERKRDKERYLLFLEFDRGLLFAKEGRELFHVEHMMIELIIPQ